MFYQSMVFSVFLFNCMVGGSAEKQDILRLDWLLRKVSLVVGQGLDSVEKVVEWRTLSKFGTILLNWSHHSELIFFTTKKLRERQTCLTETHH